MSDGAAAVPAKTKLTTKDALRKVPDPCVVVIFGASGDLTERKLMPALFSLACEELAAGTICRCRRGPQRDG